MNKPTYDQLQSQLAAALAKNKELEQRIKESQEHKPIAWCYGVQDGDLYGLNFQGNGEPLYAAPVINQQPASEPDTSESREAEIDKERHHGY